MWSVMPDSQLQCLRLYNTRPHNVSSVQCEHQSHTTPSKVHSPFCAFWSESLCALRPLRDPSLRWEADQRDPLATTHRPHSVEMTTKSDTTTEWWVYFVITKSSRQFNSKKRRRRRRKRKRKKVNCRSELQNQYWKEGWGLHSVISILLTELQQPGGSLAQKKVGCRKQIFWEAITFNTSNCSMLTRSKLTLIRLSAAPESSSLTFFPPAGRQAQMSVHQWQNTMHNRQDTNTFRQRRKSLTCQTRLWAHSFRLQFQNFYPTAQSWVTAAS